MCLGIPNYLISNGNAKLIGNQDELAEFIVIR